MEDKTRTKSELLEELGELRRQVAALTKANSSAQNRRKGSGYERRNTGPYLIR